MSSDQGPEVAALDLTGHTLGPLERPYPRHLSRGERIRSPSSLLQEHSVEGGVRPLLVSEQGWRQNRFRGAFNGKSTLFGSCLRLLTDCSPAPAAVVLSCHTAPDHP